MKPETSEGKQFLLKLPFSSFLTESLHIFPAGEFVKKLARYEIVIPKAVDKSGNFISHIVQNRAKVTKSEDSSSETDLHYEVSAFGRKFQLQLVANKDFLSPGFVIESGGSIQTRHGKKLQEFMNCHYVGRVKNATNSWLAMSTCSGLVSASSNALLALTISVHNLLQYNHNACK